MVKKKIRKKKQHFLCPVVVKISPLLYSYIIKKKFKCFGQIFFMNVKACAICNMNIINVFVDL